MDKKTSKKKQETEQVSSSGLPVISLESCEVFDPSGNQMLTEEDATEEFDVDTE